MTRDRFRRRAVCSRLMLAVALLALAAPARGQGYQFADMPWGISPDSSLRLLRARGYRLVKQIPGAMAVRGSTVGHPTAALLEFSDRGLARAFVVIGKADSTVYPGLVRSLDEKYGAHDVDLGELVQWTIRVPIGGYTLTVARERGIVEALYECPFSSSLDEGKSESAAVQQLRRKLAKDF